MEVKQTERGWGGHYICASDCEFRRNTLLQLEEIRIVVSTVGNYVRDGESQIIGFNRYYETMVFHASLQDGYWDADVSRECQFVSSWLIDRVNRLSDQEANDMHEAVVVEIRERLLNGDTF